MKYFSVDLETTGLDPVFCEIVEIAVVADDLNDIQPVESLPYFHCYIDRTEFSGQPYALSLHSEIFRRIANQEPGWLYLKEEDVRHEIADFAKYALDIDVETEKVTAAGKNFASFDRPFLEEIGVDFFHHRSLDPAPLYFDPKVDKVLPGMELCLQRAGLPDTVSHKALDDARQVIHLIRKHYART